MGEEGMIIEGYRTYKLETNDSSYDIKADRVQYHEDLLLFYENGKIKYVFKEWESIEVLY